MFMDNYYGQEEVKVLFRRLYLASMEVKEKIRDYIIAAEYELDEKDFLKLLTYDLSTIDEALKYYEDLDTAARESFVCILNHFDEELMVNAFRYFLNVDEINLLTKSLNAQNEKLNSLMESVKGLTRVEYEMKKERKNFDIIYGILTIANKDEED